jgi:hypothetical protein
MPAGIITRFISRIHYLIKDDHYWNTGVELHFSGSSALVVGDTAQKRIRISVTGCNNTQLMGIIRSHFEHIHSTLNMNKEEHVSEEVPCICPQCISSEKPYFYEYSLLQKLMEKNRDAFCKKSSEDISVHRLLNGLLPPKETGTLFDNLVTVSSQLQEIKKTLQPDENSRNTVLALLLQARGFCVKDQTLSGLSASGEGIGELDIKIFDREIGRAVSIIEALKLDSCNNSEINHHVKKLLNHYDCSGLKENYILVYASVKDFKEFCRKYHAHILKMDYSAYPLKNNSIEETKTGFNKIAAYRAHHQCNQGETVLNHLLVEM